MPVSADDTRCSANGNMLSGKANQRRPRSAICHRSALATGFLAAGNSASVAKPMQIRRNEIPFGPADFSPSAINRKEAPQMRPGTIRSSQPVKSSE